MLDILSLAAVDPHFVLGASDPLSWWDNLIDLVKQHGGKFLKFLGIVAVVVAGWHFFRGCTSKSNKGKSFILFGVCAAAGVGLYIGGLQWIQTIGDAGYSAGKGITK